MALPPCSLSTLIWRCPSDLALPDPSTWATGPHPLILATYVVGPKRGIGMLPGHAARPRCPATLPGHAARPRCARRRHWAQLLPRSAVGVDRNTDERDGVAHCAGVQ
eukprot:353986-Chlamydomonas_euryale.AAC.3